MKKKQGFILIYTVLILGIILITGGIFISTILKEVTISRDEAESLKAFYAADTGIECVRYLTNKYDAFNTKNSEQNYSCGVGSLITAGSNPTTMDCTAKTYNFTLNGLVNGACSNMTVTMVPRTITVNGVPTIVCDTNVTSAGKNSCTLTGNKVVERTRWETM